MSGLRTAEIPAAATRTRHCTECDCQLSRYNKEDRCSACLRRWPMTAQESLRVPAQVWDVPEVRIALAERDFGRLCTLVRTLGNLRQDDMVTLTGLSQSFLSMLETGARRLTNIDRIVELLAGLNVPVELTGLILRPQANMKTGHFCSPSRVSPSPIDHSMVSVGHGYQHRVESHGVVSGLPCPDGTR